jgi:hypothetical protein
MTMLSLSPELICILPVIVVDVTFNHFPAGRARIAVRRAAPVVPENVTASAGIGPTYPVSHAPNGSFPPGGGGGAVAFVTVTDRPVEMVAFPAVSVALAVRDTDPFSRPVVSHAYVHVPDPTVAFPRVTPLARTCTPATPDGSVTVPETVAVPVTVAPAAGAVTATVGPAVSGAVAVVRVTVATADRFPAASLA